MVYFLDEISALFLEDPFFVPIINMSEMVNCLSLSLILSVFFPFFLYAADTTECPVPILAVKEGNGEGWKKKKKEDDG